MVVAQSRPTGLFAINLHRTIQCVLSSKPFVRFREGVYSHRSGKIIFKLVVFSLSFSAFLWWNNKNAVCCDFTLSGKWGGSLGQV